MSHVGSRLARTIFFVKSQRTVQNPHDCCDLTSFSFKYFCFSIFHTDPRVRSFFCTVLRTKSTEIWLGSLAQATAKIIYSELVQPPLASFCCKLLNKNSWLKTLLLVFPEISGKIRKKRAPSREIKLLRRKFFKKFKAYILVYTRWSGISFDRAIIWFI